MTFRRLAAIALIFLGTSAAWTVLGSSLVARSGEFDSRLGSEVQRLWSGPHHQIAPDAWILRPGVDTVVEETKDQEGRVLRKRVSTTVLRRVPVALESTRATVDLDLEHRRKGLLWYATYAVRFQGTFTFRNPEAEARELHVRLPLPAENALFDDFVFAIDGRTAVPANDVSKEMTAVVDAAPGAVITVGAIVTLFVLMQMTAHVSWDEMFRARTTGGTWESGHASRE